VAAPATYGSELREARDLDSPTLVIRQVHVKRVELVAGHEVHRAENRRLRLEVVPHVEHEAAIAEARGVHDPERRKGEGLPRDGRGEKGAQRLHAVEDTRSRTAPDADAVPRIHHELVGLDGVRAFDGPHLEPKRRGGSRPSRRLRDARTKVLDGEVGFRLQLRRRGDRRHRLEDELPFALLERRRRRKDRRKLLHRNVAHAFVEGVLRLRRDDAGIPAGLRAPLERNRRVVLQRMTLPRRVVEDDVGADGDEADVRDEGSEVLELGARARREPLEIGTGNDPEQRAGNPFDGGAAPYALRNRVVHRVEVDRPTARGEGLSPAVGQRERGARGPFVAVLEEVFLQLPLQLERRLGRAARCGEAEDQDGESMTHAGI
jgi:hypothetical protein